MARADNLILSFMQVALPSGAEETSIVYAMQDFERWAFLGTSARASSTT